MKKIMLVMLVMFSIAAIYAVNIGDPVPGRKGIVYAAKDGSLIRPAPGYNWTDDSKKTVVWTSGLAHPQYPNVISAAKEEVWSPAPGYRWLNDTPGDLRVVARAVYQCNQCQGSGQVKVSKIVTCSQCSGQTFRCAMCNGNGRRNVGGWSEICVFCLGTGTSSCQRCMNTGTELLTGTQTCPKCDGAGRFVE